MAVTIGMTSLLDCPPRWATPRTPDRPTIGGRLAQIAERAGTPLMPWQQMVADVGGELIQNERGMWVPAYREVVFTVPRQNGKTTLILSWELDRALSPAWGSAQRIVYTAQTGDDARRKMREDQWPVLKARFGPALAGKPKISNSNTEAIFKNGSRLVAQATTEQSGHGTTNHLSVLDELFADEDERRQQAAVPSMITNPDAQILAASTAGTERSVVWNRKVRNGRAAVESDLREGIAFFEWSADPDSDPDDPRVWRSCMPAWGYTIDEPAVRHARLTLEDDEFRRAFLNIPRGSGQEQIIPDLLWRSVCSTSVAPKVPTVFAVDAHPDLERAWIVAADGEAAELIDVNQEAGNVAWVIDWLVERARKFSAQVALDINGPVGHFASQLELRGVSVIPYTLDGLAKACGWWWQQLGDDKLRVRSNEILDAAVGSSVRRFVGDKWLWVRSRDTDTSPLMALTVAQHAASTLVTDPLSQIF